MSYLLSLELWDFQPHAHRLIKFDPLVTVLVGPNGAGKSSLIRALRWVAFNRPLGDSVIRWGAMAATAKLVTESCKVERERGNGVNQYRLDGGKPYDAIGTEVPAGVTSSLRLAEVNFQKQVEAPFWLAQSAPEVAREMNRVVDLEVIDRSMSFANSKIRSCTSEVKILTGMVQDAEARAGALRHVPQVEGLLKRARAASEQALAARQKAQSVYVLVEQIREARRATVAKVVPDVSIIDAKIKQLQTVRQKIDGLKSLLSAIKTERGEVQRCQTWIEANERELRRIKPETCGQCGQVLPGPS